MREHKYRVWIPDIKRIYQVMSLDVEPQNGRQKYVTVWEHPSVESAIIKGKVARFRLGDGVELIEYTGLKDKNGVEIYKGDLIKNIPGRIARVFYCEAAARFDCEFASDKYCHIKIGERRNEIHHRAGGFKTQDWADCVEVIGNIHENPELLENPR